MWGADNEIKEKNKMTVGEKKGFGAGRKEKR